MIEKRWRPIHTHTHLFAIRRGQWTVAVLGETHLQGNVEGHSVLLLCEVLGDLNPSVDGLVCTGDEYGQRAGKTHIRYHAPYEDITIGRKTHASR